MKRGTPRHPKCAQLQELLDMPSYSAVGILEMLWHFAAEFAPQGDIGRYSDKRIEAALGWDKKTGELIRALCAAGWIDEHSDPQVRLVVHDWHDHCEDAVRKRLERGNKPFLSLTAKVTGKRRTCLPFSECQSESVCLPLPLPLPLPRPEPKPNTCPAPENGAGRDGVFSIDSPPFDTLEEKRVRAVKGRNGMTTEQSAWFSTWWDAYWLHVAKKPAEQAFKRHVKTEPHFRQVLAATNAQKPAMLEREPEKRPRRHLVERREMERRGREQGAGRAG
jgi:hypothetical protein